MKKKEQPSRKRQPTVGATLQSIIAGATVLLHHKDRLHRVLDQLIDIDDIVWEIVEDYKISPTIHSKQ